MQIDYSSLVEKIFVAAPIIIAYIIGIGSWQIGFHRTSVVILIAAAIATALYLNLL